MPPTTASYGATEVPAAKEETFNVESLAPYIAEFVGTFILVFTVGCCSITGSGTWNATAIGSVLMVMIYATGPVSGGNLNPAVSLALFLSGKIDLKKMLGYWAAQLVAGIVAGFCFCALLSPNNVGIAAKAPFTVAHAAIVEIIYTFMICFVVLNCAGSKRNNPKEDGNQFFALAIGFVIIAGGYATGDISGACFNPAVSLGLDISSHGITNGLIWAVVELLGACLAAILFRICRPEEQMDDAELSTYKLPRLLPVRMRSDEEHLANVGRAALLGHDGASAGGANAAGPSQPRDALSSCAIQVDEVKDVMKRNVDQMLQNMDKTANLETSTQELAQQANAFRSTARRTRKKMCWQNAKMYLALSGTCLIFLLIVGWASGWFSR